VEGEGRECDLEADHVTFAEGGIGRHEVFGTRHMDFLPRHIAETIAVSVKANRSVETCFAARPAYADVTSAVLLLVGGVVRGLHSTKNLAFPVPASFANADIGAGHTEAFFSGDASAGKVKEDVRRGIFEVEAGSVGFCFRLTVILGGNEGWVGYAMDIAEAFAVIDTVFASESSRTFQRWRRRTYCSELS